MISRQLYFPSRLFPLFLREHRPLRVLPRNPARLEIVADLDVLQHGRLLHDLPELICDPSIRLTGHDPSGEEAEGNGVPGFKPGEQGRDFETLLHSWNPFFLVGREYCFKGSPGGSSTGVLREHPLQMVANDDDRLHGGITPRAILGVICKEPQRKSLHDVLGSCERGIEGENAVGILVESKMLHTLCTESPARTVRPKCQCFRMPSSSEMRAPRLRFCRSSPNTMVSETE